MNELVWFISSFIICLIGIYFFKKWSEKKEFALGIDINKLDQRKVPEATGIVLLGSLWLIGVVYFLLEGFNPSFLGWLVLLSVFSFIGFFDDTRHKWTKKPLSWKIRAVPIALASMGFAFFFSDSILLFVPLALFIAFIASFHNTFAGLNGWEIGSSYIISLAVIFLAVSSGFLFLALILSGIILALLLFNLYPAKVFPGDSGTLLIGAGIAGILVMTKDIQLILLGGMFYIPHIIDFVFLKMLTNAKDPSQTKIRPYKLLGDGKLAMPDYKDGARYDFAKLVIRVFGPLKEWKIVLIIWLIVVINCLLWLFLFQRISF
ncbi:MAG: hypothetical protein ABIE23_06470 [archaeon]|nr:hypothetical protein [Candidatus Micrarchaeota archaeon]